MSTSHVLVPRTDREVMQCFPVMHQLRPHLVEAEFLARVRRMEAEGFHLAAVTDDDIVRAVAGYRYHEKLFSGRTLYVDDLVSDTTHRSRGHGARLLAWLAGQAKENGCHLLELDSGVQRFDAHRFYFRERMQITSYHFSRNL